MCDFIYVKSKMRKIYVVVEIKQLLREWRRIDWKWEYRIF